jgi:hypothetical protein
MNISSDEFPLSAGDFLLLLKHMLSASQEVVDLPKLRAESPPFTEEQAWQRARLLASHLDIPEGRESYVAEGFARVLQNAGRSGKISNLMMDVIRSSRPRFVGTLSVLDRYQEKVLQLLRRSPAGVADEDAGGFAPSRDGHVCQTLLDTSPLTRRWPQTILKSTAWKSIESPVPGVPDLPLHHSWVNLTLRQLDDEAMPNVLDSRAWQDLAFDRSGVGDSIEEVLLKTQGLTVIIGLPGAGKSTLIKWIARYVITEPTCPFGIPIVISLRHYARERAKRPGLSLLDYFLHIRGVTDPEQLERWRSLALRLRDPAPDKPRPRRHFCGYWMVGTKCPRRCGTVCCRRSTTSPCTL